MEEYQNCNCIYRLEGYHLIMNSLRQRLQGGHVWLERMEERFMYLPATENMDNPPAYMVFRQFIDLSMNAVDDCLTRIRSLLHKQQRNGHTAPATRRQSRRLLKQHHNLVANMKAECVPLYDRINDAMQSVTSTRHNFARWLLPSVFISNKEVDNDDQCAVCLENFVMDETVSQLGCEHRFHFNCMNPLIMANWQKNSFPCPLCRRPFLERPYNDY